MKAEILVLFIFLLIFAAQITAQDNSNSELIAAIRKDFYAINENESKYLFKDTNAGYRIWYDKNGVYKIVKEDEVNNTKREYYFRGTKTSFYFAFYVDKVYENRYYFNQGKLIRWINPKKEFITENTGAQENLRKEEAYAAFDTIFENWQFDKDIFEEGEEPLFSDAAVFFALQNRIILKQEGLDNMLEKLSKPKVIRNGRIRALEYEIPVNELPKPYQELAERTFYSPQKEGIYRRGKILKFIYRKEYYDSEYWTEVQANLTDEEIIKRANDSTEITEFIAQLDYCNKYVSLSPCLAGFQEQKNMPENVKNTFIKSKSFQIIQKEFDAFVSTNPEEKPQFSNLEKYISYKGGISPIGTTLHIVSLSVGNPCGGDFYKDYMMLLTEEESNKQDGLHIRKSDFLDDGFWIKNYFQNIKTGTIYFELESNERVEIKSLSSEGESKKEAMRRLHFITCGC